MDIETNPAGLAANAPAPGGTPVTDQPKSGKPSLADVLAKKARGETLTPQDRGVLGASKKRELAKFKFTPAPETDLLSPPPVRPTAPPVVPKPVAPAAPASDNPLLAPDPAAAVPAAPVVDTEFSSERCLLAAEALCDSIDLGGQLFIGYQAEQAGGDRQTCAEYESAVAMRPRNRKLVVEGSEPVIRLLCRWFNCPPEKLDQYLKGSGFAAGIIAHAMVLSATMKSIGQSKAEKPKPTAAQSPA